MSQVFPKSANAWSKASVLAIVFVLLSLGWVVLTIQRSDFVTSANQFIEQPVQFSHQHHAGGIGIDCRYCHTSVEVSPSAGIPPTKTCINCHSQIWSTSPYLEPVRASFRDDKPLNWVRVHDLPDFVYFNHSIHVTQGRRLRNLPRPRRQDAVDDPEGVAADGVVPGLSPRPVAVTCGPATEITTMGYQPAVAQAELGPRLVKEYKIAGLEHMTSCSVCHR